LNEPKDEVRIEMPDDREHDESARLLGNQNAPTAESQERALARQKDSLIKNLENRTGPEVQESFPQGSELQVEPEKPKRPVVKHELELDLKNPPFNVFKLYRMKGDKRIDVGEWKGGLKILSAKNKEPKDDLNKIFAPTEYHVRLYILEAFQLVPKDADGSNDPYLIVRCGNQVFDRIDLRKEGTSRPGFFDVIQFNTTFPTASSVTVEVWDYDLGSASDLIGRTRLDLESRINCPDWKALSPMKPIEYRTLWNPSSANAQGQIAMWVDIMTPQEARTIPVENITPPAPVDYELRCIVWETRKVPFKDATMSDIFVTAYPEGAKPQYTDTHWRSENGEGKFNWRMNFRVTVPNAIPKFKVQIWDKDILNPNDAIAEANLNLRTFYMNTWNKKLSSAQLTRQWCVLSHPSSSTSMGEISLSFDLLTLEEASRRPAGKGREGPDALLPPVRPETSFNPFGNPFKSFQHILWGQNKGKIIGSCVVCCLLLIGLFVLLFFLRIL